MIKRKEEFRNFFEINKDWINCHSLCDTDNLKEFYDMYFEYINDNGLMEDKGIDVFRIVIKQEIVKSLEYNDEFYNYLFDMRKNSSDDAIFIDNPIIKKWYKASITQMIDKNSKIKQNRRELKFLKKF